MHQMAMLNATRSMSVDEALVRLEAWDWVGGVEEIALADALSRISAEDIIAPFPMAPFDSAAMDGFAFSLADVPGDRRMELVARVSAGHPMTTPLGAGKAARIFTGAAMPLGADTVAMQEDCQLNDGFVCVPGDLRRGTNRRLMGEDVAQGSLVIAAGTRLRPQDIGMVAAAGRSRLMVRRRLRVALLSTGDELRSPGLPLPNGCIYDANRHAIRAALLGLGAEVSDLGVVPDRLEALCDQLSAASVDNDLIISTGGVSAGDNDHVRAALLQIGTIDFWNLAIKPGKPVAFGEAAGTPFIGLPGNPVAAMVVFWLIARPLLLRLMGMRAVDLATLRIPVIAAFKYHRKPGQREYLRARLRRDGDGCLRATIYPSNSSAQISSLVWANGLIELKETMEDVEYGDFLDFMPFETLA